MHLLHICFCFDSYRWSYSLFVRMDLEQAPRPDTVNVVVTLPDLGHHHPSNMDLISMHPSSIHLLLDVLHLLTPLEQYTDL